MIVRRFSCTCVALLPFEHWVRVFQRSLIGKCKTSCTEPSKALLAAHASWQGHQRSDVILHNRVTARTARQRYALLAGDRSRRGACEETSDTCAPAASCAPRGS